MKRHLGGTAVMIKIPDHHAIRVSEEAGAWLSGQNGWRTTSPNDYHVTLQFVGRDLDRATVAAVVFSTFMLDTGPIRLQFTGGFKVNITGKGTYLVAEIAADPPLLAARDRLRKQLAEMGVTPKDGFKFSPHVTTAEAPPKTAARGLPLQIEPFSVECGEIIVKYGPRRMVVDL
jgi:2'-5' RNA ligase